MDRDRVDVLVGASQKALMSPPGVAFVGLSPRAIQRLDKTASKGFYFSLQRELKNQKKGTTAFTPAISLLMGMDAALDMISQEGRDALFARHRHLQKMAREAFQAMGLELFNSQADATCGMTVAKAPAGLDVKVWLKELRKKYGLWLAGGQGELEGKIFRLSHMGYCSPEDLLDALGIMEESLASILPKASERAGTRRAKELLKETK
jgi:aspartate aminotransferase-like enzyme